MNEKETIKKTISLGKVDGYGNGRKSCEVTIDIRLKDGKLSICGNVWNPQHTDTPTCGQCYDTLLELLPGNEKLRDIVTVWKRWHLNDMRAECEHQRELGWIEQALEPLYAWELTLDNETLARRKQIRDSIAQQIKNTRHADIGEDDGYILGLANSITMYTSDPTHVLIPEHYRIATCSYKSNPRLTARGWTTEAEDPAGILLKPCPICGYKYGSEWKFEAVPDSIIEQIKAW